MKAILSVLFFSGLFSVSANAYFLSYFEIKLNHVNVYNSVSSTDDLLELEADSLEETDLFEVNYFEWGATAKNDYEMHIKVENTTIDLTFINDLPSFAINMGWLTQFKNRKATIYLYQTKYTGSSSKELVHKIVDVFIS